MSTQELKGIAGEARSKKVVFVFDRVAHYHGEMFRALETALSEIGMELHLLSGQVQVGAVGRVGVGGKTIEREEKYRLKEYQLNTYTVRVQHGVMRAIASLKPDVVVNMCHVGNVSHWAMALKKRRLGYKLVAWQCGYEYHPSALKDALLRRFVGFYDHHLAYHSNARLYALQHGARDDQITVIHNTINERSIARVPRGKAREALCAKHPALVGKRIVLFVGAILEEKKVPQIVQAMDQIGRKDVALVVVGDGPYLPVLKQEVGARDDVVFTGAIVEGVGPYFDAADVYVLPGTGGLGMNEAMAHDLPIVAGYADGSADDLVVDGKNGFRLREGSIRELGARLRELLDSPSLAEAMGRESRRMITEDYSFDRFIERIKTALCRVARQG